MLIWLLIENDFSEINEFLRERSNKYLKELPQNSGSNKGGYEDAIFDVISKPPYSPTVQSLIKALEDQRKEVTDKERLKYQEDVLRSIDNYHKGILVFLTLSKTKNIGNEETNIIKRFQNERKNTYFFEDFVDLKAEGLVLPDQHPNKDGHKKIGSDLFTYLKEKKLIPCN